MFILDNLKDILFTSKNTSMHKKLLNLKRVFNIIKVCWVNTKIFFEKIYFLKLSSIFALLLVGRNDKLSLQGWGSKIKCWKGYNDA